MPALSRALKRAATASWLALSPLLVRSPGDNEQAGPGREEFPIQGIKEGLDMEEVLAIPSRGKALEGRSLGRGGRGPGSGYPS